MNAKFYSAVLLITLVISFLCSTGAIAAVDSAKYKEIIYPDGIPELRGEKFKPYYKFLSEYSVPGTNKTFVAYYLYNGEKEIPHEKTCWARVAVLEKKSGKLILKKRAEYISKNTNGRYSGDDLKAYLTGYDAYEGTKGIILCLYTKEGGNEYSDAFIYLTCEKEPLEQSFMFPYMKSAGSRVDLYLIPPGENGRAGFATRKISGNMKQRGYSVYGFFEEDEDCKCFYKSRMRGYRLLKTRRLPKNARKIKLPQSFEEAGK